MNQLHDYFKQRKNIYAPQSVHRKIAGMVSELPDMEPVSLPLFWARPAFVMAGILLIIALSGGMVAAAQASKPGSPLFPIKKAIVNVQVALTKDESVKEKLRQEVEEPAPTAVVQQPHKKADDKGNDKDDAPQLMQQDGDALHSEDSSGGTNQISGSHDGGDDTKATIQTTTNTIKTQVDDHNTSIINPTPTPATNGGSGSDSGGSGNLTSPTPSSPSPTKTEDGDKNGGH